MNIVFAISEVEELVKTGGLADVGKALPLALDTLGESITIVMPYYQVLAEQLNLPTVTEQQTLFTEGQVYHFDIRYMQWHGIPIYFVDSPEYFMRDGLYANAFEAYEDNGERFSFFSGAVLQTLKAIDKKPDIIPVSYTHLTLPTILRV